MDNITYIVPVLKLETTEEHEALTNTLNSITAVMTDDDYVIVTGPDSVLSHYESHNEKVSKEVFEEINLYGLVNEAVMRCTTEYFSIIEPGEEYTPHWADSAKKYNKNYSVLLPLVRTIPDDDKPFLSNELVWSAAVQAEDAEIGYITLDFLERYIDLAISGAYFNTEDFISIGKFKPSLKIVAWYEFLLRCAHKSKKIFVVPKIGVERPFVESTDDLTKEEVEWLIKTARQEYFFSEDRNKKFKED